MPPPDSGYGDSDPGAGYANYGDTFTREKAGDIRSFVTAVAEFAKKLLPEQLVKFQKLLALQALSRIVRRTPVDTGRARGNWQVSIGAPAAGEIAVTVGADGKGPGAAAGREAFERGRSTIAGMAAQAGFPTIWLTNNLPYILVLEDGSSKQAPNGMVAVTLAELEGAVSP